jgi:type IX secretion system PorP/SprF family membrane protein
MYNGLLTLQICKHPKHPLKAPGFLGAFFLPCTQIPVQMKSYFLVGLFCSLSLFLHAQDPMPSQFWNAPLNLNPAFTGQAKDLRINMNYQNSLPNDSSNFSIPISLDFYFNKIRSGVGLNGFYSFDNNFYKSYKVSLCYAYHFSILNKVGISLGLEGGLLSRSLDLKAWSFGDMIDPRYGFVYQPLTNDFSKAKPLFDLNAGLSIYTKNISIGLAAQHLTRPNLDAIGSNRLPIHWIVSATGDLGLVLFRIKPGVVYHQQDQFKLVQYGINIFVPILYFGVWGKQQLSTSNAVVFTAGIHLLKSFRIGYSYDLYLKNNSNLGIQAPLHEISFQLNLVKRDSKPAHRF